VPTRPTISSTIRGSVTRGVSTLLICYGVGVDVAAVVAVAVPVEVPEAVAVGVAFRTWSKIWRQPSIVDGEPPPSG